MKKKLLSLLLVLVMAATLLPTGAFALQVELPEYLEPWRPVYTIDNYDPNTGDYGLYSLNATFDPYGGDVDYPTRANAGELVQVWIYPAKGYKINQVFVKLDENGTEWTNYGNASAIQFIMPAHNVDISVSFTEVGTGMYELGYIDYPDNTVSVSFTDARGYSIGSANAGDIVNMTVNAKSGYKIKSVSYSNYLGNITNGYYSYDSTQFTYQFAMPASNTYFTINTEATGAYSISVSSANSYYGSVSIKNGIEKANYGDTVTFTVRPAYQYILKSVSVYTNDSYRQSIQVTRDKYDWNTFSFTMPAAGVVIAPTYTSDYYTISVDGGSHGSVSIEAEPAGTNSYYGIRNEYVYIDATPNTGYKVKSVTVVDKYNDSIKVYESSTANRYYFTMPDSNVTVNVEFTPRVMSNPFTDVRSTDWFYDAVNYVYSEGIMDGTSVYMFSPNNATSRGMLVTILWRLAGQPVVTGTSFSDVSSSAYYYYAVLWASKYGIVDGLGNNMFGPDQAITREQFAVILYRYAQHCGYSTSANSTLVGYADSNKISSYALTAMRWACGAGLFEGDERANLNPQGQTTRAAAAKLLMTFQENVAK